MITREEVLRKQEQEILAELERGRTPVRKRFITAYIVTSLVLIALLVMTLFRSK